MSEEQTQSSGVIRLRWTLLIICAFACLWAVAIAISGGFVLRIASTRVLASRTPWTAAILSAMTGLAAAALTTAAERRRFRLATRARIERIVLPALTSLAGTPPVRLASRVPPQLAPLVAASAAAAVLIVGLTRGAPYAGGADVYGYVSQAHLWATGRLRVEQPFVLEMKWPFAAEALTPLGYRPTQDGTAIVPIFSPGFPMVMAVFERVAGRQAVFLVVPLLGALAVWATYLMGTRLAGQTVGVSAAVLLATSPMFLFELMFPMSDVPVTAWWALALGLMLSERPSAAFASGLAAGAAILTRSNLVPLAAVLGLPLAWRALRARDITGPAARRTLLFAAGVVPACIVVAVINARSYGSPLASGYERFDLMYGWTNLVPNLNRYPRWLFETQTHVVLLALIAPFVVAPQGSHGLHRAARTAAITWLCFIATIFLSYLFFLPNNTWVWLRYILPAFPPLLVLTSVVLVAALARLDRGLRLIATAAIVGAIAWHGLAFGLKQQIFDFREGERRPLWVGEYIASRLPQRAVFISKQHSGSIRYYSGRLTVRYEQIPSTELDSVVADLARLNYRPYIVLEEWEEPEFRKRFAGHSRLAALDWPPVLLVDRFTKVRIYDPADRDAPPAVRQPTAIIR